MTEWDLEGSGGAATERLAAARRPGYHPHHESTHSDPRGSEAFVRSRFLIAGAAGVVALAAASAQQPKPAPQPRRGLLPPQAQSPTLVVYKSPT